MTSADDFDRNLTTWLDARAPTRAPEDLLRGALVRTARTSQRPSWLVPERWTAMQTSLHLARVPRPAFRVGVLVVVALALIGLLVASGFGAKLFPVHRPIAFTSTRDGGEEIYLMSADGSNVIQLTTGAHNVVDAWSSDGTKLLFTSNRDGNDELYTMNADGSDQTRLTVDNRADGGASYSPDGRLIIENVDTSNSGCYQIFVLNADGSGRRQVTPDGPCDWAPAWSPDGRKLAFARQQNGNFEIWTMNPDGSSPIKILGEPTRNDAFPQWSPDGTKLVYTSWDLNLDGTSAEIGIVNAGGTGNQLLTTNSFEDSYPTWSPDGQHIVFQSNRDGDFDLYVMNVDGSGVTLVAGGPGDQTNRAWH